MDPVGILSGHHREPPIPVAAGGVKTAHGIVKGLVLDLRAARRASMACKKPKASASSPESSSGLNCLTQPNRVSEISQKRPSRASSYQGLHAITKYSVTQMAIVTEWASRHDQ